MSEEVYKDAYIKVQRDRYRLMEQNKRYRNAIENVLEIENYGVATDYIKTVTNILLEALEEHK